MPVQVTVGLWGGLCIAFALLSAAICLWYLLRRPPLVRGTKLALLLGLLLFPGVAALAGNAAGLQASMQRPFCASCHVMEPWTDDAADAGSDTLASQHSRNPWFGEASCYTCHADYRAFGAVSTKITGLLHVFHYLRAYRGMSIPAAVAKIRLYAPYPNANCNQCHSMQTAGFSKVPDHGGALEEIRSGDLSCASAGCHGPAHPFSKVGREDTP